PVKANPVGNDTVVQALLDAGVDIPEPPKEISEGTVKNIPLTQAEQREYRKTAGDGISREVAAVLNHPAWASASAADRADEIKAIVEDARQAARDAVLERIGPDEAKRRVAATVATPAR
ncbi:MAG TPA: hypothetical protein VLB03_10500, partial [Nocardioidaceae bacterium]|nr:hypothetical protein [Nocardioidaceae bacterium]